MRSPFCLDTADLQSLPTSTKLFWLLPPLHEAPSLSLLLPNDHLQISDCSHLTWHALQFSLIPSQLPVPLPFLIHPKPSRPNLPGPPFPPSLHALPASLGGKDSDLSVAAAFYFFVFCSESSHVAGNKPLL